MNNYPFESSERPGMMELGWQFAIDFYDCDQELINDPAYLERALARAAEAAGATVIKSVFHEFSPHGVTGVIVIAESHLSIHTWPEYRYAAVDIFTCSQDMNNLRALDIINEALRARTYNLMELKRGIFTQQEKEVS